MGDNNALMATDLSGNCLPRTAPGPAEVPDISVIIPFRDEERNLPGLLADLLAALRSFDRSFELVFVDDGSRDGGATFLEARSRQVPEMTLVRLSRNYGQTTAIAAGLDLRSEGSSSSSMPTGRTIRPTFLLLSGSSTRDSTWRAAGAATGRIPSGAGGFLP